MNQTYKESKNYCLFDEQLFKNSPVAQYTGFSDDINSWWDKGVRPRGEDKIGLYYDPERSFFITQGEACEYLINSEDITAIDYDRTNGELTVNFKGYDSFRYDGEELGIDGDQLQVDMNEITEPDYASKFFSTITDHFKPSETICINTSRFLLGYYVVENCKMSIPWEGSRDEAEYNRHVYGNLISLNYLHRLVKALAELNLQFFCGVGNNSSTQVYSTKMRLPHWYDEDYRYYEYANSRLKGVNRENYQEHSQELINPYEVECIKRHWDKFESYDKSKSLLANVGDIKKKMGDTFGEAQRQSLKAVDAIFEVA